VDRKTHARFLGGWARATAPGYPTTCLKTIASGMAGVKAQQTLLVVTTAMKKSTKQAPEDR
jgi:hypothetical protein